MSGFVNSIVHILVIQILIIHLKSEWGLVWEFLIAYSSNVNKLAIISYLQCNTKTTDLH